MRARGPSGAERRRAEPSGPEPGRAAPSRLVVSLLLQPAAGVAAQVEAPDLVVDEDRQHEGDGGQPPHEPAQELQSYQLINIFDK